MNYIQLLGFWADLGKELGNIALKILFLPFTMIFLLLDGVVYTLVAYSYKLFELMARMNFNTIYMWLQPVIDRIQALILVLVLFMVGYTLITYLIDPDKVGNGATGVALLKNIAIAAILLVFYSTVFDLLNEFTFVLIGAPEKYSYDILDEWFGVKNNNEPGLISNLIFGPGGTQNEEGEEYDFGRTLAVSTLSIFLHKKGFSYYTREENSSLATIYSDAMDPKKEFSLISLPGVALDINFIDTNNSEMGGTTVPIEYKYPILSTAVGLYLVYTLVTIAIEIGVRAFKLIILQILAPIAIITIIKDGWKSKIWQNFLKTLGSVYANLFIRVGSMYFVTALISIAWNNINDLYDDAHLTNGFTQFILLILIVVAGYRVAKTLPQFLDQVLGTKLADNTGGFGGFLKSLAAGTAGLALGTGAGLQAAHANGLSAGATAFNALRSGYQGARAGIENKGKNIAQTLAGNTAQARANAEQMKGRGGTLRSNIGYGIRERTGANYAGAIRTAELTSRENTTHSENIANANTEYQRNQSVLSGEVARRTSAEDSRYAARTSRMDSVRSTAQTNHNARMARFDSEIRQHEQAKATAIQAMQSSGDSRFVDIDSGQTISFGSNADTYAQKVAANDTEYNQFKEAAEHFRLDAASATSSADRSVAIENANKAERAALEAHTRAIENAKTVYETAKNNAIATEEAAIQRLQNDKQQEEGRFNATMRNIETRQSQLDNDHQANMSNIENYRTSEEQRLTNEHNTRIQSENTRHSEATKQYDRDMQKYTGKKPGGN